MTGASGASLPVEDWSTADGWSVAAPQVAASKSQAPVTSCRVYAQQYFTIRHPFEVLPNAPLDASARFAAHRRRLLSILTCQSKPAQ